jgi:hypothetical protein
MSRHQEHLLASDMLLLAGFLLQLQVAKPAPWRVIEHVTIPWGSPPKQYTVILDEPVRDAAVDDEWQRIRVRAPSGEVFTTRSGQGPLVPVREGVFDSTLVLDNLTRSTHFYLSPKLRTFSGAPMLLLFGFAYASDPGSLKVLAPGAGGLPIEAFSSNEFELTAVEDLNGDGSAELIGKPSLSQCGGCNHCSYDPFAVYRFPTDRVAKRFMIRHSPALTTKLTTCGLVERRAKRSS